MLDEIVSLFMAVYHAVQSWAIGYIIIDRHRERKRTLSQQPDSPPDVRCIDGGIVDILAVQQHLAFDMNAFRLDFEQTVQRFEHRRFAASRGTDDRRDLV